MINLLNPVQKKNYRAARRNTMWIRYILLLGASFIVLNIILGLTAWYITSQEAAQNAIKEKNVNSQTAEYKANKQKIEDFRTKLKTAKTLLDNETSYSDTIVNIASSIPPECNLSTIALNSAFFGTPQSLSFKCIDQSNAVTLKSALENKPQLFEKVSITSSTKKSESTDKFKADVIISAVVKKPAQGVIQ